MSENKTPKKEDIESLLRKILEMGGFECGSIVYEISGPETIFSIETDESGRLIGQGGEVLSALNCVFRKILENKYGETETIYSVDVNNYRAKARERLIGMAMMLAERAITFKHEVELEPMSSYQRRVVHSHFQNHPNIETESRGEGKWRHIVIKYVEAKNPDIPKD
jgi:spoIIIJ-associated protein